MRKLAEARELRRTRRLEHYAKERSNRALSLTQNATITTMPLVGEAEAGFAGAQHAEEKRERGCHTVPEGTVMDSYVLALKHASVDPLVLQKTQSPIPKDTD